MHVDLIGDADKRFSKMFVVLCGGTDTRFSQMYVALCGGACHGTLWVAVVNFFLITKCLSQPTLN